MTDTKDRLAEIRGRLGAATPGEWEWSSSYGDGGGQFLRLENDVNEVVINAESGGFLSLSDGDFDFIQHAPTDIRYLLDENERLHADGLKVRGIARQAEEPI